MGITATLRMGIAWKKPVNGPVISVSNLAKRYSMRSGSGEGYTALRDVIADQARHFLRRGGAKAARVNSADFWALQDVSFQVEQGEVIGVIGRNGAGKSTLLKILSRITEPTTGSIRLRGRVASLLEVGTGFHSELTGRENIFLNGAILGMTRAEIRRKFDEIVAFADIGDFLEMPVKRYSSGMAVRLAFSVAAFLDPEILIVDEVLAVGDTEFQQRCIGRIKAVASEEGRTVLFVSHSMQAITSLCSRALLLQKGKLIANGPAPEVVEQYLASTTGEDSTTWIGAAGDDDFRVTRFQVIGTGGDVLRTDRPLVIEIEACLHRPILGLVVAVEIWTSKEHRLAYTAHDDALAPPATAAKTGQHRWRLHIPANTFAAGTYRFHLDAGIHNVRHFLSGVRVTATLENTHGIGRRFQSPATHLFRPDWKWESSLRFTPAEREREREPALLRSA